ncbi:MAG: tRNA epoxyqueuosine(34) reductase QueG [Gemmatimonadaceae bacterium]|jgi:epoxyqueuosine reductase|nr:tRNA epoxyqueuosine(34) reductase QueG [Gemmatimonadaceae bacterium]
MTDEAGFRTRLEAQAYGLGFDLVGVAALGVPGTVDHFDRWLEAGYHGEMAYMARGAELRRDARRPHPGATHAIVVGMRYGGTEPSGPIARYARGDDYHDVMRERLRALIPWLATELGRAIDARPYVDSGPLLERDLARRAGLGWFGKNTMLINPRQGSFFFLGALVVDVALPIDAPFDADRCGSCTRCLDACPTQAFPAPRVLDATRCISYWTIEHRGEIPAPMRALIGELLFGCDICQEVCPWNVRFAMPSREPAFAPRAAVAGKDARTLATEWLAMDEATYRETFRGSAITRAKLEGVRRNAAIVLENLERMPAGSA